jgi:hypothetical protein
MTDYRIADDVAWVSHEDLDADGIPSAYVTRLPQGPPITLEGSACVVWLAIAEGGDADEITTSAAQMWDADPDQIRGDVVGLIAELIDVGLVTEE